MAFKISNKMDIGHCLLQIYLLYSINPCLKMDGATTVGLPAQKSPSQTMSPVRRLPRKSAPKYSSCLLYSTKDAKEVLDGLTIASCNPSYEGEGLSVAPEELVQIPVPENGEISGHFVTHVHVHVLCFVLMVILQKFSHFIKALIQAHSERIFVCKLIN